MKLKIDTFVRLVLLVPALFATNKAYASQSSDNGWINCLQNNGNDSDVSMEICHSDSDDNDIIYVTSNPNNKYLNCTVINHTSEKPEIIELEYCYEENENYEANKKNLLEPKPAQDNSLLSTSQFFEEPKDSYPELFMSIIERHEKARQKAQINFGAESTDCLPTNNPSPKHLEEIKPLLPIKPDQYKVVNKKEQAQKDSAELVSHPNVEISCNSIDPKMLQVALIPKFNPFKIAMFCAQNPMSATWKPEKNKIQQMELSIVRYKSFKSQNLNKRIPITINKKNNQRKNSKIPQLCPKQKKNRSKLLRKKYRQTIIDLKKKLQKLQLDQNKDQKKIKYLMGKTKKLQTICSQLHDKISKMERSRQAFLTQYRNILIDTIQYNRKSYHINEIDEEINQATSIELQKNNLLFNMLNIIGIRPDSKKVKQLKQKKIAIQRKKLDGYISENEITYILKEIEENFFGNVK